MLYKVYYKINSDFFSTDPELTVSQVQKDKNFAYIKDTEASGLENLYMKMQGEIWSPNGEARELIQKSGAHHTSMSVGDVAVDSEGKGWQVDLIGWKELKEE